MSLDAPEQPRRRDAAEAPLPGAPNATVRGAVEEQARAPRIDAPEQPRRGDAASLGQALEPARSRRTRRRSRARCGLASARARAVAKDGP